MIAALFVSREGHYWNRDGIDAWDEERDARNYSRKAISSYAPSVVAHPPCTLWTNMAAVNWKRYGRQKPAWYEGGHDGECFRSALSSIAKFGGVIEHPAFTHAWKYYHLPRPPKTGWSEIHQSDWGPRFYSCEVWQSAYGHKARKRTWLLYCGNKPPMDMNWERKNGTHQIGWFDRNKPTLGKTAALLTPPAFADALIELARGAR